MGLQIRKGVGGTCPARAAARGPALQSVLTALAATNAASETMANPYLPPCTAEGQANGNVAAASAEHHTQRQPPQHAHQQLEQAQWLPDWQQHHLWQQTQHSLQRVMPNTSMPTLLSGATVAGLATSALCPSSHTDTVTFQHSTAAFTATNAAVAAAPAGAPVDETMAGCSSTDTSTASFAAGQLSTGGSAVSPAAAATVTAAVASTCTPVTVNGEDPTDGRQAASASHVVHQQTDAQWDKADPAIEEDGQDEGGCGVDAATG